MLRRTNFVTLVALLVCPFVTAFAADLSSDRGGVLGFGSAKDGGYWIVTLGGYGAAEPDFLGAKHYNLGFVPIFDIRGSGEPEKLSLPNDAGSLELFRSGNFHFGVAADYLTPRNRSDDRQALRGLDEIDYSLELGVFAEYWPVPFFRTRVELLQAVTGDDGFLANFSADYVYRPDFKWQFTVGPRLQAAGTQFESAFFSVDARESAASGLPTFHASGGFHSAGVEGTARYNFTDRFSIRAFAEYQRLLGDAADSPITRFRGSEDQFEAGLGAAYSVDIGR